VASGCVAGVAISVCWVNPVIHSPMLHPAGPALFEGRRGPCMEVTGGLHHRRTLNSAVYSYLCRCVPSGLYSSGKGPHIRRWPSDVR